MFLLMNVKTAELKNRLSSYLRRVRERGETLVVCDRDRPVATISPIPETGSPDPSWLAECHSQRRSFEERGLRFHPLPSRPDGLPGGSPVRAPDGDTSVSTVERMRSERNY